ncbi:MAG: hypothetical protein LCH99_03345, partial [Proteobacteria bacterium]|nr:hypothetical protein [Pseudomonadota bacterium]
INIARGSMIDDAALLQALDDRRLSGATLDVTSPEPLPAGHRLYTHPAVRLTPHISGAVDDADARMSAVVLANFDCWLHGRPLRGVVNPATGY